jgi:tetratricopeptide (TPR) repeat protein
MMSALRFKVLMAALAVCFMVVAAGVYGQTTQACGNCGGTGKTGVDCYACGGKGIVKEAAMQGLGTYNPRIVWIDSKCKTCNGAGKFQNQCSLCSGSGRIALSAEQQAKNAFARGEAAYEQKNYDKAITEFTEVIRLYPTYVAAYYYRGEAFLHKSDYDRAIADYTQALRHSDDNVNKELIYGSRGFAYQQKGEINKAIEDYESYLRIEPNKTYIKSLLETLKGQSKGQSAGQQAQANKGSKGQSAEQQAQAAYERGEAAFEKQNWDKAITEFTEVIKLFSNYPAAYVYRGSALMHKSDYDRALADFNTALRESEDPEMQALIYGNRGTVYSQKGERSKAIENYEASLYINPDQPLIKALLDNLKGQSK